MTVKETVAYGRAGTIAEEVLSAIRIVAAYAGEEKEVKRYDNLLSHPRKHYVCQFVLNVVVTLQTLFAYLHVYN